MYKELIISIIIIISIFLFDKITTNYLQESTEVLTGKLEEIKNETEEEKRKEQMKNITEEWEKRYEKLAYYIEHDELEKVKTKIVNIKSNIETKQEEQVVENIDEAIYLLEHIKEKDELNLKDIF